jgi:undecaprenyl-diphosphatase
MSVTGGLKDATRKPVTGWISTVAANVTAWLALFRRPPMNRNRLAWRSWKRFLIGTLLAAAAIAAAMVLIDAWLIVQSLRLPTLVVDVFDEVTDFGKSGWLLVPAGIVLVTIALSSPALDRVSQRVAAAIAVRFAFVFLAIALPGFFASFIKRVIGRGRPHVTGTDDPDPFHFLSFVWRPDYASLPSGHATTAFAALVAVGIVWPQLRAVLWIYAIAIAISRVVVHAHYPSDVLAGAALGAIGAMLVRDWFAARRLAFRIDADGSVHALPGPSFHRVKRVARRLIGQ